MPGDQCEARAELDGCDRCADRPVHPTWNARVDTFRQWPQVRCPGGSGLDHYRLRKDGLHRTSIAPLGTLPCDALPGSAWENGYCESFNARFRDEFLNGEIFYGLREAQILIEQWRKHYNTKQPHIALGYRPPAPVAVVPMDLKPVMH